MHYAIFGRTNSKSCPMFPKLRIWLLRGWLKVTLQTRAPEFRHTDTGKAGNRIIYILPALKKSLHWLKFEYLSFLFSWSRFFFYEVKRFYEVWAEDFNKHFQTFKNNNFPNTSIIPLLWSFQFIILLLWTKHIYISVLLTQYWLDIKWNLTC